MMQSDSISSDCWGTDGLLQRAGDGLRRQQARFRCGTVLQRQFNGPRCSQGQGRKGDSPLQCQHCCNLGRWRGHVGGGLCVRRWRNPAQDMDTKTGREGSLYRHCRRCGRCGKLQQAGNSLFLDYVLRLPYKGSEVDVHVDDRMYLVSPDILINESGMSKFGWRVGNLVLVIARQSNIEGSSK